MKIEAKVIALTNEVNTTDKVDDSHLFIYGGKAAGVCYMPEDYFDGKIQNEATATKRAMGTCSSGHHSVFEHGSLSLQISGIPKIMAMLLNSTEQYSTSEKSARYTVMRPETQLENDIYDKWKIKFEQAIEEARPDIDAKTRSKLALENARYMISVFTPTHMIWTTNYRQLAYVIDWLARLAVKCAELGGDFNRKLAESCDELRNTFEELTTSYGYIHDNKDRDFEFLTYQSTGHSIEEAEYIGDVYQTTYLASFAQVAQLHRHRTIHYEIEFNGDATQFGVYVPPIIAGTDMEAEWKEDFEKVAYCYPQGTLVKVLEQGRAIKFFDKCKERLCNRAQLEIMNNSKELMEKFIANKDKLSIRTQEALDKVAPNGKVVTKCMMCGIKCTEQCGNPGNKALNRLI